MNFSEAVDTLLEGPFARHQIERAIGTILPQRLSKLRRVGGPLYLIGNGGDFREYTAPLAKGLGENLLGVACLWTHKMDHPGRDGRVAFSIPSELVEPTTGETPTVVVCQSILANATEIIAMTERMLQVMKPSKLIYSSCLYDLSVAAEFHRRFGDAVDFDGIAVEMSLEERQVRVFDALDDRALKVTPLVSRWLANRFFGPGPKPRYSLSPQMSPG